MVEYAERTVDDILEANVDAALPFEEWPLDVRWWLLDMPSHTTAAPSLCSQALAAKMQQYCYVLTDLTGELLRAESGEGDYEALRTYLRGRAREAYYQKVEAVEALQAGLMQDAQRFFMLTQTDNLWKEHLQAIRFLQTAVGLRGYAQRDPLTEYKLEAYNLFLDMMAQIRRNVIYNVYMFQPVRGRSLCCVWVLLHSDGVPHSGLWRAQRLRSSRRLPRREDVVMMVVTTLLRINTLAD